jgi:acetyl-CoA carboxylase, biotin carboxylase subunit
MRRVLVANRGEIAVRIIRACRKLGLESVAIYSDGDDNSSHIWAADRAIRIGAAPPSESYLNIARIVEAAQATKCDALHPGYGFLSERAELAKACEAERIGFVGPSDKIITLMGDKAEARRTAEKLGIPIVPGSSEAYEDSELAAERAREIGFPILLKALAGGGGRGMRVVPDPESFPRQFTQAASEARNAFGNGGIYLERFVADVRHIEVQVFGDVHGNVVHLWERDCTVQRRHQKLVEESPSPALDSSTRKAICEAAVKLAAGIGYIGAGTVEFIYDAESKEFFFIEMNTRIQVEHPVTEALTGLDLVVEQLRVAGGQKLSFGSVETAGHAIELRINAEDSTRGFAPSPGTLTAWRPPLMTGVRFDSHAYRGYAIPRYYDSLIGKLIIHSSDRSQAIERALAALDCFEVAGVVTTIPFHRKLLRRPEFIEARIHTRWVDTEIINAG